VNDKLWDGFCERNLLRAGDFRKKIPGVRKATAKIQVDDKAHSTDRGNRYFYLAVARSFAPVAKQGGADGLKQEQKTANGQGSRRKAVRKRSGFGERAQRRAQARSGRHNRIYRIDPIWAKKTVRTSWSSDLRQPRGALVDRNFIDSVQITAAENVGGTTGRFL